VPQGFQCKGDPNYKTFKKQEKEKLVAKVDVFQIVGPTPELAATPSTSTAQTQTAAAIDTSTYQQFPPAENWESWMDSDSDSDSPVKSKD
jgi:hypothetical protein